MGGKLFQNINEMEHLVPAFNHAVAHSKNIVSDPPNMYVAICNVSSKSGVSNSIEGISTVVALGEVGGAGRAWIGRCGQLITCIGVC